MAHNQFHYDQVDFSGFDGPEPSTLNAGQSRFSLGNSQLPATNNFGFGNNLSMNNPLPTLGGDTGNDTGFQWFGKNGALIPGLDALSGIMGAINARKTLKGQKEAFAFNKGLAETNLANVARTTNAEIEDTARNVGRQTGLTGKALDRYVTNRMDERRVSGTVGVDS